VDVRLLHLNKPVSQSGNQWLQSSGNL